MRNLFLLIKNYFKCFIGNITGKKNHVRYSVVAVIGISVSILFLYTFAMTAEMTIKTALEYEKSIGEKPIAYAALLSSSMLAIICSILSIFTKATLSSKSSDEDLLLSFPIKKTTITTAKVVYNYLFDFMLLGMILLPNYYMYWKLVPDTSFLFFIRGIIISLVFPLLVQALSFFIGYLIRMITKGFKYGKVLQSLIVVIVLIFFLVSYYGVMLLSENNAISTIPFFQNFPLVKWMIDFLLMNQNGIMSFVYLFSICLGLFILSVICQARLLGKEHSTYKTKNKELVYKESKVFRSLYKKEMSYYFSVPIYVINTILFGVVAVVLSIVVAVMGKDSILNLLNQADLGFNGADKMINLIIVLLFSMMIGSLCTTAPSISLEGKRLWFLKAHPISEMEVFFSKILVNMTLSGVSSLITSVAVAWTIGFEYLPLIFILFILISFFISMVGIISNLYFPRFDWDNEQQPIKQGMSVLLCLGISFFGVAIPFAGGILLISEGISDLIALILIVGIYIIIDILTYFILKTKGVKLFRNL